MNATSQDSVTQVSELPAWTTPTLTELHLATNTLMMNSQNVDGGTTDVSADT